MPENKITIKYKDSIHITDDIIQNVAFGLGEYLEFLQKISEKPEYDTPESFLRLPFDKELFLKSENLARELVKDPLKYVIVVGIGGSNLGASAVYDAIYTKFDVLRPRRPKLLFADTNNSREMEALKNIISEDIHDPKEIVLNIITKSGTTVETVANAMFLFEVLFVKFGEKEALLRTVITTDEESALFKIAKEKGMRTLLIPKNIGGRYSVFSPVGIFPLLLCGVNVAEFIAGAGSVKDEVFKVLPVENSALLSSVVVFLIQKKKFSLYNNFFFYPELESVGKWGRQLMAESLGKRYDKDGNVVDFGMTPMVSIGTTDLHSMVQLYLGGPKDKFTNFVYTEGLDFGRAVVPLHSPFETLVPDIAGKDFQVITSSLLVGTMEAYKEKECPYIETVFPEVNEYFLGQYFMIKMVETILLAMLWNINPFDQPEVESYKKVARKLLKN